MPLDAFIVTNHAPTVDLYFRLNIKYWIIALFVVLPQQTIKNISNILCIVMFEE